MEFVKMHGLGNDFILVEGDTEEALAYNRMAALLCDRHTGIGADGLMVVLPSSKADIRMRIINADGSEAEMCGNGIRCFARYVYDRGMVKKERFTVETLAGIMEPEVILAKDAVIGIKVNMGCPDLDRKNIPMEGPAGRVQGEDLVVGAKVYKISSMLMGVPHTMVFVEDVSKVDLPLVGPAIERHPSFPRKTNVNFVEVINPKEIRVRTWERGAGVTLACGTGSCASVVAAHATGLTEREVIVHLALGDLKIDWTPQDTVYMTGPAVYVFKGSLLI